jgi:hypothetical protein
MKDEGIEIEKVRGREQGAWGIGQEKSWEGI